MGLIFHSISTIKEIHSDSENDVDEFINNFLKKLLKYAWVELLRYTWVDGCLVSKPLKQFPQNNLLSFITDCHLIYDSETCCLDISIFVNKHQVTDGFSLISLDVSFRSDLRGKSQISREQLKSEICYFNICEIFSELLKEKTISTYQDLDSVYGISSEYYLMSKLILGFMSESDKMCIYSFVNDIKKEKKWADIEPRMRYYINDGVYYSNAFRKAVIEIYGKKKLKEILRINNLSYWKFKFTNSLKVNH